MKLTALDWLAVAAYLAASMLIGLYFRRRSDKLWVRISRALERHPMPDDAPPRNWWERFVASLTGSAPPPVPETHVKDWRPLSA